MIIEDVIVSVLIFGVFGIGVAIATVVSLKEMHFPGSNWAILMWPLFVIVMLGVCCVLGYLSGAIG